MKVFDDQANVIKVGQKAADFHIEGDLDRGNRGGYYT